MDVYIAVYITHINYAIAEAKSICGAVNFYSEGEFMFQ